MNKNNFYFLGIGGIGMSALAQYFLTNGYNVAGYDKTKNNVCEILEKLNINIHYDDNVNLIPEKFKNFENTLIIYTPAITNNNSINNELEYFKSHNFEIVKRAQVLGFIANPHTSIAISGTHGKTSISSICANIMSKSIFGCSAFLGGIANNFHSNFTLNDQSDIFIVEADEYDRSFLQLLPSTAIITHIDPDHLDIYGNYENVFQAFVDFGNKVKPNGNLIISNHVPEDFKEKIRKDIKIYKYGFEDENCDFFVNNIFYENNKCYFNLKLQNKTIEKICYPLGGKYNLENALAAASASFLNGATDNEIRFGLENFLGVERRFDIKINSSKIVYIDDYAHHPNEIKSFLTAIKQLYPNKKITGIFQPHLFSRTNDFYKEFAESLSLCDNTILLPIYPAREKPIPGVTSDLILKKITKTEKQICEKSELLVLLRKIKPELLVTMGAGDIDQFVAKIVAQFTV
ncbi:MAG: UDP-N-acetylmuramate--L-alanine ligase [Bacteroidales bacterium]|jgi:UDP-N-acetylmuramate--alanine ligase|nr:UDP-N-acetylmuramate--L-alanine ligase [Bacteroidales bacterium]